MAAQGMTGQAVAVVDRVVDQVVPPAAVAVEQQAVDMVVATPTLRAHPATTTEAANPPDQLRGQIETSARGGADKPPVAQIQPWGA